MCVPRRVPGLGRALGRRAAGVSVLWPDGPSLGVLEASVPRLPAQPQLISPSAQMPLPPGSSPGCSIQALGRSATRCSQTSSPSGCLSSLQTLWVWEGASLPATAPEKPLRMTQQPHSCQRLPIRRGCLPRSGCAVAEWPRVPGMWAQPGQGEQLRPPRSDVAIPGPPCPPARLRVPGGGAGTRGGGQGQLWLRAGREGGWQEGRQGCELPT